ncbi:MAG: acyl-ACP--UDP-N-acetylglucosamine O-acyltransferase [Candidatus Omnitrophica bacterium]|nr:acyl-ACP--UDP-N-acetylglucosamine O-acyltransferase [Candidatus Omnitrophota bacterium]
MSPIHKHALVHPKAQLDDSVQVGPFAVIEENVQIGAGTVIGPHAVITGHTKIGKNCRIFSSAVVGSIPQDLKYKGEKSYLIIGDNNIIREFCTINPGTGEAGKTIIGNNNLLMAYVHVAHDCKIGNYNILVNNATLGGHVQVEDHCLISALTAVHQFVRVGQFAIIGGCSKVVQDIPPFAMADGHPARVYGLNLVGLKRNNFSKTTIKELDKAFKILFQSGLSMKNAIKQIMEEKFTCQEVNYLVSFIKNSSRGVIRARNIRAQGEE